MYPSAAITAIGSVSSGAMSFEDLPSCYLPFLKEIIDCKVIEPFESVAKDESDRQSGFDFLDINLHKTCSVSKEDLHIHPKDARIMDKHTLMLIKTSEEAFNKAGFNEYYDEEIGFFAALGMVDYHIEDLLPSVIKSIEDVSISYRKFFKKGYREIYPLWPLSMLNNIALCQAAIRLSIKGENGLFSPHSDSSLQAIHEAAMSIGYGHCKAALAGGISEVISPSSVVRYILCNTNSSRVSSDVLCPLNPMAEGGAVFALEDIKNATTKAKKMLAVIRGFGSSFGFDNIYGGVTKDAVVSAMGKALRSAELAPADIDIVFTHYDTSKQEGDNELRALREAFGNSINIVSTKRLLGDMLSGAGAFDVALAAALINTDGGICNALINASSVEGNTASIILGRVD